LDKAASAVDDLIIAIGLDPADHYAVIWLHIARARAGQHDDNEIRSNAEKLDRAKWPWPVVDFLAGSSTAEAVRARAQSAENENTRQDQICEVDFYLGVHLRPSGAKDEAQQLFEAAVQGCPKTFWEYAAAKNELKALK
jgi:lipoprotein NlpI